MNTQAQHRHTRVNLLLALALLFLGWFQLHHEITAHLEHPDSGCVICVFTGHLGNGATPAALSLPAAQLPYLLDTLPGYTAPALAQPFRLALSQRGPPLHAPA